MTSSQSLREHDSSAYQLARGNWSFEAISHEHLVLPMERSASATARAEIERRLGALLGADEADILKLVVTELVTNSVRHSGAAASAPVELHVAVAHDRVRVEVIDAGTGFERPDAPLPRGGGQAAGASTS